MGDDVSSNIESVGRVFVDPDDVHGVRFSGLGVGDRSRVGFSDLGFGFFSAGLDDFGLILFCEGGFREYSSFLV